MVWSSVRRPGEFGSALAADAAVLVEAELEDLTCGFTKVPQQTETFALMDLCRESLRITRSWLSEFD